MYRTVKSAWHFYLYVTIMSRGWYLMFGMIHVAWLNMIRWRPGWVIDISLEVRVSHRVENVYFVIFHFLNFFIIWKKKLCLFFEFFEFLNFCDVKRKGWGYAHIREMGVSMVVCGDAAAPGVFVLNKLSH